MAAERRVNTRGIHLYHSGGEITWVNGCVFTLAISSLPASFQPEGLTGGLYGGGLSNGSCCFGHGCILVSRQNACRGL